MLQPSSRNPIASNVLYAAPNSQVSSPLQELAISSSRRPIRNTLSNGTLNASISAGPPAATTLAEIAQAWPNSNTDNVRTPRNTTGPVCENSHPPFRSVRNTGGDQRGVIADFEDEQNVSLPRMSQAVDRPAVPGFSRNIARQAGSISSQRPSLLGTIPLILGTNFSYQTPFGGQVRLTF